MEARSTWHGGFACTVTVRDFDFGADEPLDAGGDNTGPAPTELLLAALASCFTMAVAFVARKKRLELGELAVQVTGEAENLRITGMAVELTGDLPRDQLEALIEPARKVCFVSNTLADPPQVTYRVAGQGDH